MPRLKILWRLLGWVVLARNYPSPFAGLLESFQMKVTDFFPPILLFLKKTNKRPLPCKRPFSIKCLPWGTPKVNKRLTLWIDSLRYYFDNVKQKTTRCKQTRAGDINLASINLPCGQTTFPLHLWWITPFWSRRKIWSLALQAVPFFLVKMR